jgi:hypothetical protein
VSEVNCWSLDFRQDCGSSLGCCCEGRSLLSRKNDEADATTATSRDGILKGYLVVKFDVVLTAHHS